MTYACYLIARLTPAGHLHPEVHSILQWAAQRQKAPVALLQVPRRYTDDLLQEEIYISRKIF